MAPPGRTLIDANRDDQIRTGVTVSLMLLKLGEQLKAGQIAEDEYLAAHVAAEKLGHDQAAIGMAGFIRRYRALMDPDQEHAEPVLDEFDQGASVGRAVGTVQDLRELQETERTQAEYDSEFAKIIERAAATAFRHVLNGGRDTMAFSAAANGTGWRRVTGPRACAFCVMLATRSDYRTKESAMVVVGRANGYGTARYKATGEVTYGGTMARGAQKGQDRRRGTRAPGQRYHDHCSCTVAEVVGEVEPTAEEVAQRDLYERAAERCDADGVPHTDRNVMERMRQLDDGTVIYDAHLPETEAGGAGGGAKPPRPPLGLGEPPDPGDKQAWAAYWKARQDLLEGPSFTARGERLDPDEVLFVERMVRAEERLAWIKTGSEGVDAVGTLPTNDFEWLSRGGVLVGHKSIAAENPVDLQRISRQIVKATDKNKRRHTVDVVMVDVGDRDIPADVVAALANYNLLHDRPVKELWLMSHGVLERVALKSEYE